MKQRSYLRGPNRGRSTSVVLGLAWVGVWAASLAADTVESPEVDAGDKGVETILVGVGDSLTHGTMDARNNSLNTLHAYLQAVADSLAQVSNLTFRQPLYDEDENRILPSQAPSNLGVDGADVFTLEGKAYYKRNGTPTTLVLDELLGNAATPAAFDDDYDKVLYPWNLLRPPAVSQVDAANLIMTATALSGQSKQVLLLLWIGNNDSSLAALGSGGRSPTFLPIPRELIADEISPLLNLIISVAETSGTLSFAPYTLANIQRNLTDVADFWAQYNRIMSRLQIEGGAAAAYTDFFLCTLPYYSSVGYLMDSEDLEFYFRKVNPAYSVPPSFRRVAAPGQPITDPLRGDRVSLLTFGLMYALLETGYSVDFVNQALEIEGVQRDGLVLSQFEQLVIRSRIERFNTVIRIVAATRGPRVHLIDVGAALNDALTGVTPITVGGQTFSRKWTRGGSFTLDGVHPGYVGQALVASIMLQRLNELLQLGAPLPNLEAVFPTDPYIDHDLDGWAPGPNYATAGISEVLFLLRDPNDADPGVQVDLPDDVWQQLSAAIFEQLLGVPQIAAQAAELGLVQDVDSGLPVPVMSR